MTKLLNSQNLNHLAADSLLASRFRVVKEIGHGANGTVYECLDELVANSRVAVKIINPHLAINADNIARLEREIRSCFRINSPFVIRFLELIHSDNVIGYAMEYINGGSLQDKLNAKVQFALNHKLTIISQIAQGVKAIHEAGIIHRDLKPANILISKEGYAKIADLGLARVNDDTVNSHTHEEYQQHRMFTHGSRLETNQYLIGTPLYLAPEYINKSQLDERSDIYAIGMIAYELISGTTPFKSNDTNDLLDEKINTDPDSLTSHTTGLPEELCHLVDRMIARNPINRIQSADDIVIELNKIIATKRLSLLDMRHKSSSDTSENSLIATQNDSRWLHNDTSKLVADLIHLSDQKNAPLILRLPRSAYKFVDKYFGAYLNELECMDTTTLCMWGIVLALFLWVVSTQI